MPEPSHLAVPTRHDLLLGLIGVSLAAAALLAAAFPVSIRVALAAGSLPAVGGVGYALFCDPPDAVTE